MKIVYFCCETKYNIPNFNYGNFRKVYVAYERREAYGSMFQNKACGA